MTTIPTPDRPEPAGSPAATVAVDFTTTVGTFTVSARFAVGPGITALFGPSGAGKSVTLASIAGLLRPTRGSISLNGTPVADTDQSLHVRTQDRRLAMVFQQAALLPHRTPLDNVALAVPAPGRAHRRAVAARWLERVHAEHLATTPTRTLSGGEQQRVALARALAGDPHVLLLDEPFSALDQPTRHALRALVRELVDAQHLSAIIVTHDLEDITHLADRVVRYEPGRTLDTHDLPVPTDELPHLLGIRS
jgi:molybdate transport system ATP-binding protein